MKTNLERTIKTDQEAIDFLTELYRNGECFHPEDDAHDVVWHGLKSPPTGYECELLNLLMGQIESNTNIDACEILIDLDQ